MTDVVATATTGLATESSLLELRTDMAKLEARIYRAMWVQGMGILGAIVAATGIILAAMRLWM